MGKLIGYETINGHLKMICTNNECRVDTYSGEPLSTNTDGVDPSVRAYSNPLFAHVCILCNSMNVEPIPIFQHTELEEQELRELDDQTLREHEERQEDYESMLPPGSCGITVNEDGEWWH